MSTLQEFAEQFGWLFKNKSEVPNRLIDCLVILLPTWSVKDIKLIEGMSSEINLLRVPVYVLDIDEFSLQDEVMNVFGSSLPINQTPVIFKFIGGELVKIEQGESVEFLFSGSAHSAQS